MKVFVSGASGLLGSNILKHFTERNYICLGSYFSYPVSDLVFFDTLDMNNPRSFDLIKFAPDVIIHCGALTHVDYCEEHEQESYIKTVQSTLNLINYCNTHKVKFVFISTDYVFDGKNGPYSEAAITNPLSRYGKHKLEAETKVAEELDDFLIIRVTNLYGDELRNKNFVSRILEQIKAGENITLTLPKDQYATPTHAMDVAKALWLLLENSCQGIYHLAGIEYLNRVELAMEILKLYPNARHDLKALSTTDLQQKAPRPLLGGLIRAKFANEFPLFQWSSVREYIQSKI